MCPPCKAFLLNMMFLRFSYLFIGIVFLDFIVLAVVLVSKGGCKKTPETERLETMDVCGVWRPEVWNQVMGRAMLSGRSKADSFLPPLAGGVCLSPTDSIPWLVDA